MSTPIYQVQGTEEPETGFTICCNGEPIKGHDGELAHLFPHGDRPSRKAAYAAAKEFVDRLNKTAKNSASSAARTARRAAQSN